MAAVLNDLRMLRDAHWRVLVQHGLPKIGNLRVELMFPCGHIELGESIARSMMRAFLVGGTILTYNNK